jgi:hypothetical protein
MGKALKLRWRHLPRDGCFRLLLPEIEAEAEASRGDALIAAIAMNMSDPEWVEDLLEDLAAAATGDLCYRREPPGSTTRAEQASRAEGCRPNRSAAHESATRPAA